MPYVTPFNKPLINNVPGASNWMWQGWGVPNNGWMGGNVPTANSNSLAGSPLGEQIYSDFMNSGFDTQASMWRDRVLKRYLMPYVKKMGSSFLNKLETSIGGSQAGDFRSKYGISPTAGTMANRMRGTTGGPGTPTNGGGASTTDPYAGMTKLFRDNKGMIHDPGDNPLTGALGQLPATQNPTTPTPVNTGGYTGNLPTTMPGTAPPATNPAPPAPPTSPFYNQSQRGHRPQDQGFYSWRKFNGGGGGSVRNTPTPYTGQPFNRTPATGSTGSVGSQESGMFRRPQGEAPAPVTAPGAAPNPVTHPALFGRDPRDPYIPR